MNAHEDTIPPVAPDDELVELDVPGAATDERPGRFRCTDLGNAERLLARHGTDLRYVGDAKTWLWWNQDAGVWEVDKAGLRVQRLAQDVARAITAEASQAEADATAARRAGNDERAGALESYAEALAKWGPRSEDAGRTKAMIGQAQCREGVPVLADDLDADPFLFVLEGGVTVEIRDEVVVRESRREDLCTKRSPVKHEWNATHFEWDRFLLNAMRGDVELVSYLQRVFGYCLTADVSEQCFFFCYGPKGRNGKGTFLRILGALLGPHNVAMPPDLLIETFGTRHPVEIARLKGARTVIGNEVKPGSRWNEARLKELTGADRVGQRAMHENFSDAKPTWKLWLSAQERPIASSSDEALWRRMHIIPWDNHIEEAADDHDLYHRLAAELPGILAWAIEGAQAWKRGGLQPPEAVKAAKADYRRTSDYIAQFIEDTCEVGGGKGVTSRVTTLYSAYTAWCKREGHHPIASNKFSGELHRRGYEATPALPRQAGVGRAGVYGLQIDPRIVDSDEDRGTRWFG